MNNQYDIICVGELLIDFIGNQQGSFSEIKDFHRFLGGSPTNVAVNATRLGLKVALVAACGNDGLGIYIQQKLKQNNVSLDFVNVSKTHATSVILISKSSETPDFIAYRAADSQIIAAQISDDLLSNSKIFHTTCFALSQNPARNTILETANRAHAMDLKLSIDINFSDKIWNNADDVFEVLKEFLAYNPLVKLSEDDCLRLFGEQKSDTFIFEFFNNYGANIICLTKGKNGVSLFDNHKIYNQQAMVIDNLKDTTGAGDAFWTGFLFAKLNSKSPDDCLSIAQKLASIKLQNVGRLPENRDIIAELL